MSVATEDVTYATIFDPQTCQSKGLCAVSKHRTPATHNIYYEIHGVDESPTASKLVFIMGLNNSCFGWHNQISYFGRRSGYRCLVMDNRGVGNSDTPSGRYSTSDMAKDVNDLLEHVGWTQEKSLHVIGVSMGGMIAQELVWINIKYFPAFTEIIEGVSNSRADTVAGSNFHNGGQCSHGGGTGISMFTRLMFIRDPKAMVKIIMEGLYPSSYLDAEDEDNPGHLNRERVERDFLHRADITRKQTLRGRLAQTAAALGHRVSEERLAEISHRIPKIVILTGDKDGIVNPERSRDLANMLPGSEYIVFPEVGHAIPSQCNMRYNEVIARAVRDGEALSAAQSH